MSATSATLEQLSSPANTLGDLAASEDFESDPIEQDTVYYPITQRDPNDIRTILRLSLCSLCFALLSLGLAGLLTYRLARTAELIVVERTAEGDRVVGDSHHYKLQGSVQLSADKPGEG